MTGQELRETRRRIGRQRGQPIGAAEFAARLDVAYSTYRRWEASTRLPRHAAALVRSYLLLLDQRG